MEEFVFKMVILGEKATGKSSLIRRYVHGSFEGRYAATIGLNVSNKRLNLDRVFGGAVKGPDPEVLFDPFEKQFHPPAGFVKFGDGQGGQEEIVGQKFQELFLFGVEVSNTS